MPHFDVIGVASKAPYKCTVSYALCQAVKIDSLGCYADSPREDSNIHAR
jgi:hypothetical protein